MNGNMRFLHRVFSAGIGHQFKLFSKFLQLGHDQCGVGEEHVVVSHAVHEQ